MTKSEFLKELEENLQYLKKEDTQKFLNYYEEIIADYQENGYNEQEAIKKIGDPKEITKEILKEKDSIDIKLPSTGNRTLNIILLVLGFPLWGSLLLAFLLLVLSAYIIIWCLPVTVGAIGFSLILGAILSLSFPFLMVTIPATGMAQLGIGLTCIGLGILFILATYYTGKWISGVTRRITQGVKKLLTGKRSKNENETLEKNISRN